MEKDEIKKKNSDVKSPPELNLVQAFTSQMSQRVTSRVLFFKFYILSK